MSVFLLTGNFDPIAEPLDRCRVWGVRRWSDLDAPSGTGTWPDPTGRRTFFRIQPVDRPPRGEPRRWSMRAPLRPRQTGAPAGSNPKFPAATVSNLRVQRSQQRPRMVVTAPLRS